MTIHQIHSTIPIAWLPKQLDNTMQRLSREEGERGKAPRGQLAPEAGLVGRHQAFSLGSSKNIYV